MAAMDDQHAAELRMLRERAYGPSADIHDDPIALARLRELEEASVAQAAARAAEDAALRYPGTAVVAEDEAPDPAPGPAEATDPEPDADVGLAADPEPGSDQDQAPHAVPAKLGRRRSWLWAASLVVAGLAGAGAAVAVAETHPGRVAVLAQAPDSEWPSEFFGDQPQSGSRVFEGFLGLSVVIVPDAWGAIAAPECLFVLQAEGPSPGSGSILSTGCAAGEFDMTASFAVTSSMPEQLREQYPVGTALEFIVEGAEVFVFAKTPIVPSPS